MKRDPATDAKYDRWLTRAVSILDGNGNGMGLPVPRMLALRGHHDAITELANRMTSPENSEYGCCRQKAALRNALSI